jgi:hypothetical protein
LAGQPRLLMLSRQSRRGPRRSSSSGSRSRRGHTWRPRGRRPAVERPRKPDHLLKDGEGPVTRVRRGRGRLPADARTGSASPTTPRRGCRKVTEAPTTTALLQAARRRQRQRRRCKADGETWSREQDGAAARTPEGYGSVNNNNSDDKHGCTAFLPGSSRTLSYEQPPSPTTPRRGCRKVTEAPTTTALLQAARRRQRQRRRCKADGETWSREQDGAAARTPEGYGSVNNNNSNDKHGCTAFFVAAV